jgi:hypothetical protein
MQFTERLREGIRAAAIARHGRGKHIYLIRFHYVPAGGCDTHPPAHSDRVTRRDRMKNNR